MPVAASYTRRGSRDSNDNSTWLQVEHPASALMCATKARNSEGSGTHRQRQGQLWKIPTEARGRHWSKAFALGRGQGDMHADTNSPIQADTIGQCAKQKAPEQTSTD